MPRRSLHRTRWTADRRRHQKLTKAHGGLWWTVGKAIDRESPAFRNQPVVELTAEYLANWIEVSKAPVEPRDPDFVGAGQTRGPMWVKRR